MLALKRAYYSRPGNGAGGSLHIVLDDANLNDGDIRWCLERAQERGDQEGVALAEALLAMTKTQRRLVVYSRS